MLKVRREGTFEEILLDEVLPEHFPVKFYTGLTFGWSTVYLLDNGKYSQDFDNFPRLSDNFDTLEQLKEFFREKYM